MKIYHNYMTHKHFMDEVNPPNTQNERELWHGTPADALDDIHATGFNRSFCGKNGAFISLFAPIRLLLRGLNILIC